MRGHCQSISRETHTRSAVPGLRLRYLSHSQTKTYLMSGDTGLLGGQDSHDPTQPREANEPKPRRGDQKVAHGGAEGGTVGKSKDGMNPAGVTEPPPQKSSHLTKLATLRRPTAKTDQADPIHPHPRCNTLHPANTSAKNHKTRDTNHDPDHGSTIHSPITGKLSFSAQTALTGPSSGVTE